MTDWLPVSVAVTRCTWST